MAKKPLPNKASGESSPDAGADAATGTPTEGGGAAAITSEAALTPEPAAPAAPTGAGEVLLAAKGLVAGYGSTVVVRDLDLEVRSGEVVALLGPNGAGKTTTMMTMSGALPAIGGTVEFNGQPTTAPLFQRVRSGLGLVTEQRAVLMSLTVGDNLRVSRCDQDLALELFPELADRLSDKVGTLSGGQQQMVALARALSRTPSVLLVDELSLGLAPLVVGRLLAAVRAAADRGVGVLVVEQHVRKVLQIADRVYLIRRGRIELEGKASELGERVDEIEAAYFAV